MCQGNFLKKIMHTQERVMQLQTGRAHLCPPGGQQHGGGGGATRTKQPTHSARQRRLNTIHIMNSMCTGWEYLFRQNKSEVFYRIITKFSQVFLLQNCPLFFHVGHYTVTTKIHLRNYTLINNMLIKNNLKSDKRG